MELPPDYDEDPGRWRAWTASRDVLDWVAPELTGPVLDVGCGDGRLAHRLTGRVRWIGVDSSATQLGDNPYRPVVRADMRHLPFVDRTFAEVTHLWCLYHVPDPLRAIAEALRVLRPGGHYWACTSAKDNDPELAWEGYPPTSFDAEEAVDLVASVFGAAEERRWDGPLVDLGTRAEVAAYCRHHHLPVDRADDVPTPLRLTKRGVLVHATTPH
jgi:SAM-dependent methyltransferase